MAKVQINEYAYLNKVKLDTKRKGIATMILSHKIIRLIEIYNDTFTITATIMDDAAKAWNNGEPHEDGNPPVYIYKKIFQHERPMKKTPDSDWTDERTFDLFNREADMEYSNNERILVSLIGLIPCFTRNQSYHLLLIYSIKRGCLIILVILFGFYE